MDQHTSATGTTFKVGDKVTPDYSNKVWTVVGFATNTNGTRCVKIENGDNVDLALAVDLTNLSAIEEGDLVTKIGVIEDAEWTVSKIGWNDIGRRVAYLEYTAADGQLWTDRIPVDYLTKVKSA